MTNVNDDYMIVLTLPSRCILESCSKKKKKIKLIFSLRPGSGWEGLTTLFFTNQLTH